MNEPGSMLTNEQRSLISASQQPTDNTKTQQPTEAASDFVINNYYHEDEESVSLIKSEKDTSFNKRPDLVKNVQQFQSASSSIANTLGSSGGKSAPQIEFGFTDDGLKKAQQLNSQSPKRKEMDPKHQRFWRTFFVVGVCVACFANSWYLFYQKGDMSQHGIKDSLLIATERLNQFFLNNIQYRNYMMIVCSGLIDTMTLSSCYYWARYSTSWRFLMAMGVFYGLRSMTTSLVIYEIPKGFNWGYPGVMSLFVPYGATADFFYSGHVGTCVLQYNEFHSNGMSNWAAFCIVTMLCQIFMMVALRSHYTLDMLAAVIFAHYMFIMSERYSYLVDWHIFGIPLSKRLASTSYHHEELESQSQSSSRGLVKQNGSVGHYFITCKNCMNPVSNYMLNEQCVQGVYHHPGGADETLREGGEREIHHPTMNPLS